MSYRRLLLAIGSIALFLIASSGVSAQPAPEQDAAELTASLQQLQGTLARLRTSRQAKRLIPDIEVYAKGVEWCLRHDEFYPPGKGDGPSPWLKYCRTALDTAFQRAKELQAGTPSWPTQTGSTIRGYVSGVDGSVQPYALSLPADFGAAPSAKRWPLHVKLHGRGGTRNEVRFFNEHSTQKPQEGQDWIQLDVFGRTDNAYRWAGETDVFEAMADVRRHYRIDDRRITLWGFSMGGAGAWHLGLHHPSQWSSVGPGAGFVDFYKYQNQTEELPPYQHRTLHIYDATDYALNLANVPLITYGGELDKQLAASTTMVDLAKDLEVPVRLLVGPQTEHRFHPDSLKEFMAFHREHTQQGRPAYPGRKSIRFVTWTLKYNRCEWLTIQELDEQYAETTVSGSIDDDGVVRLITSNVSALSLARDIADKAEIDGDTFPLRDSADGLLPDVYYIRDGEGWRPLNYDESREFASNPEGHKRHNQQGPIDDAFMEPFVCVRGTGKPWSEPHQQWTDAILTRFESEFDKWMRGRIQIVNDTALTDEQIESSNVVLFGDPGSNSVLARVYKSLPLRWTEDTIEVNGQFYDPATHVISLIYPNPLNPDRYVVINSGHTMHTPDFKASNAWLFPKLGDIAVVKFEHRGEGNFTESTVWAELFDSAWQIPSR